MEVILREHVENLGQRGDIVKVANGYARNYLLPQNLALPVTAANKRHVERERHVAEAREAQEHSEAQAVADRIGQLVLVTERRVGETDTLYGSVTAAEIAEWLSEQQVPVERRKIQLADPIKQLGEFTVPIKIYRTVTAELKVQVLKKE